MAKPVNSFTVRDVARWAGVSQRTVWEDIRKRRLEAVHDATGHVWIPSAAACSYRKIPYLELGELLLSYRETAALLQWSPTTVLRCKQRGLLPVVEISPRRFRVRADAPCLALHGKSITEWASGNPDPRDVRDRVRKMLPPEADARRWGTSREEMFEAAMRAPEGRFMSARAAARMLGMRVRTFYVWRRRHRVPRYGLPPRARFLKIGLLGARLAEEAEPLTYMLGKRLTWGVAPADFNGELLLTASPVATDALDQSAKEFLGALLNDPRETWPLKTEVTVEKARKVGISPSSLQRARSVLAITSRKKGFGPRAEWLWHRPKITQSSRRR